MLSRIQAKAEAGTRLDREDGLWLLTEAPLLDLAAWPRRRGSAAFRSVG